MTRPIMSTGCSVSLCLLLVSYSAIGCKPPKSSTPRFPATPLTPNAPNSTESPTVSEVAKELSRLLELCVAQGADDAELLKHPISKLTSEILKDENDSVVQSIKAAENLKQKLRNRKSKFIDGMLVDYHSGKNLIQRGQGVNVDFEQLGYLTQTALTVGGRTEQKLVAAIRACIPYNGVQGSDSQLQELAREICRSETQSACVAADSDTAAFLLKLGRLAYLYQETRPTTDTILSDGDIRYLDSVSIPFKEIAIAIDDELARTLLRDNELLNALKGCFDDNENPVDDLDEHRLSHVEYALWKYKAALNEWMPWAKLSSENLKRSFSKSADSAEERLAAAKGGADDTSRRIVQAEEWLLALASDDSCNPMESLSAEQEAGLLPSIMRLVRHVGQLADGQNVTRARAVEQVRLQMRKDRLSSVGDFDLPVGKLGKFDLLMRVSSSHDNPAIDASGSLRVDLRLRGPTDNSKGGVEQRIDVRTLSLTAELRINQVEDVLPQQGGQLIVHLKEPHRLSLNRETLLDFLDANLSFQEETYRRRKLIAAVGALSTPSIPFRFDNDMLVAEQSGVSLIVSATDTGSPTATVTLDSELQPVWVAQIVPKVPPEIDIVAKTWKPDECAFAIGLQGGVTVHLDVFAEKSDGEWKLTSRLRDAVLQNEDAHKVLPPAAAKGIYKRYCSGAVPDIVSETPYELRLRDQVWSLRWLFHTEENLGLSPQLATPWFTWSAATQLPLPHANLMLHNAPALALYDPIRVAFTVQAQDPTDYDKAVSLATYDVATKRMTSVSPWLFDAAVDPASGSGLLSVSREDEMYVLIGNTLIPATPSPTLASLPTSIPVGQDYTIQVNDQTTSKIPWGSQVTLVSGTAKLIRSIDPLARQDVGTVQLEGRFRRSGDQWDLDTISATLVSPSAWLTKLGIRPPAPVEIEVDQLTYTVGPGKRPGRWTSSGSVRWATEGGCGALDGPYRVEAESLEDIPWQLLTIWLRESHVCESEVGSITIPASGQNRLGPDAAGFDLILKSSLRALRQPPSISSEIDSASCRRLSHVKVELSCVANRKPAGLSATIKKIAVDGCDCLQSLLSLFESLPVEFNSTGEAVIFAEKLGTVKLPDLETFLKCLGAKPDLRDFGNSVDSKNRCSWRAVSFDRVTLHPFAMDFHGRATVDQHELLFRYRNQSLEFERAPVTNPDLGWLNNTLGVLADDYADAIAASKKDDLTPLRKFWEELATPRLSASSFLLAESPVQIHYAYSDGLVLKSGKLEFVDDSEMNLPSGADPHVYFDAKVVAGSKTILFERQGASAPRGKDTAFRVDGKGTVQIHSLARASGENSRAFLGQLELSPQFMKLMPCLEVEVKPVGEAMDGWITLKNQTLPPLEANVWLQSARLAVGCPGLAGSAALKWTPDGGSSASIDCTSAQGSGSMLLCSGTFQDGALKPAPAWRGELQISPCQESDWKFGVCQVVRSTLKFTDNDVSVSMKARLELPFDCGQFPDLPFDVQGVRLSTSGTLDLSEAVLDLPDGATPSLRQCFIDALHLPLGDQLTVQVAELFPDRIGFQLFAAIPLFGQVLRVDEKFYVSRPALPTKEGSPAPVVMTLRDGMIVDLKELKGWEKLRNIVGRRIAAQLSSQARRFGPCSIGGFTAEVSEIRWASDRFGADLRLRALHADVCEDLIVNLPVTSEELVRHFGERVVPRLIPALQSHVMREASSASQKLGQLLNALAFSNAELVVVGTGTDPQRLFDVNNNGQIEPTAAVCLKLPENVTSLECGSATTVDLSDNYPRTPHGSFELAAVGPDCRVTIPHDVENWWSNKLTEVVLDQLGVKDFVIRFGDNEIKVTKSERLGFKFTSVFNEDKYLLEDPGDPASQQDAFELDGVVFTGPLRIENGAINLDGLPSIDFSQVTARNSEHLFKAVAKSLGVSRETYEELFPGLKVDFRNGTFYLTGTLNIPPLEPVSLVALPVPLSGSADAFRKALFAVVLQQMRTLLPDELSLGGTKLRLADRFEQKAGDDVAFTCKAWLVTGGGELPAMIDLDFSKRTFKVELNENDLAASAVVSQVLGGLQGVVETFDRNFDGRTARFGLRVTVDPFTLEAKHFTVGRGKLTLPSTWTAKYAEQVQIGPVALYDISGSYAHEGKKPLTLSCRATAVEKKTGTIVHLHGTCTIELQSFERITNQSDLVLAGFSLMESGGEIDFSKGILVQNLKTKSPLSEVVDLKGNMTLAVSKSPAKIRGNASVDLKVFDVNVNQAELTLNLGEKESDREKEESEFKATGMFDWGIQKGQTAFEFSGNDVSMTSSLTYGYRAVSARLDCHYRPHEPSTVEIFVARQRIATLPIVDPWIDERKVKDVIDAFLNPSLKIPSNINLSDPPSLSRKGHRHRRKRSNNDDTPKPPEGAFQALPAPKGVPAKYEGFVKVENRVVHVFIKDQENQGWKPYGTLKWICQLEGDKQVRSDLTAENPRWPYGGVIFDDAGRPTSVILQDNTAVRWHVSLGASELTLNQQKSSDSNAEFCSCNDGGGHVDLRATLRYANGQWTLNRDERSWFVVFPVCGTAPEANKSSFTMNATIGRPDIQGDRVILEMLDAARHDNFGQAERPDDLAHGWVWSVTTGQKGNTTPLAAELVSIPFLKSAKEGDPNALGIHPPYVAILAREGGMIGSYEVVRRLKIDDKSPLTEGWRPISQEWLPKIGISSTRNDLVFLPETAGRGGGPLIDFTPRKTN